jgi:hypothetical protein
MQIIFSATNPIATNSAQINNTKISNNYRRLSKTSYIPPLETAAAPKVSGAVAGVKYIINESIHIIRIVWKKTKS